MGSGWIFGSSLSSFTSESSQLLIALQPIDLTLLDAHLGNIKIWQQAIDDIHSRGMYVVMDNTMATSVNIVQQRWHKLTIL